MRPFLLGLGLIGCLGAACAQAEDGKVRRFVCLSSGDALETVSSRQVVAPGRAIVAARAAVPGSDILRASLCREAGPFVYLIMALRKDGRLVRVTVDAGSGKVKSIF